MMTISMIFMALQESSAEMRAGGGMNTVSWVFMLSAVTAVTALTAWCYMRILGSKDHFDPDGTGPASPPVSGEVEQRDKPS